MQDSILTTVVKDIDGEVTTLEYSESLGRSRFYGAGIPVQPVSGTRTGQR